MSPHFTSKVSACIVAGVTLILVLIPFHAFLTVWGASVLGHYTALRLWKELLLLPLFLAGMWLMWSNRSLWREAKGSWLFRLMAAYAAVQLILGAIALAGHKVNFAAEGWIEDVRLMVIFFVAWVSASRSPWLREHWQKIVLIPAVAVVAFGLLQIFVLPANFLTHFGYGPATIRPYELVDLNSGFVRVQSTLRGANPLGAYLVLVVATIASLLASKIRDRSLKLRDYKRPVWIIILGAAALIVLYFTYSRSAYAGVALGVAWVVWLKFTNSIIRRWLLIGGAAVCVIFGGLTLALRHNAAFEDTFFHTSQLSRSPQSSNQNRTSSLENGLHDVAHEPLGRGPGTAGPASVHNNHPARIAENYYLQIGQEVGWIGLALFLAINILLAKDLWERRKEADCLAITLLVSFVGISFINLLSHAWADDTLAYLWWGLAGVAVGAADIPDKKELS
jgi:O-Antigen ligase